VRADRADIENGDEDVGARYRRAAESIIQIKSHL
jgi:hypothetical protein